MAWVILQGDARRMPIKDESVDAIVTDCPYGIKFMGKDWDSIGDKSANFTNLDKPHSSQVNYPMNKSRGRPISETDGPKQQQFHYSWAIQALRVLKPGGFLLAFGGTRTCHRLVCAIEDAGFEIRDMIAWVYGSGFPKSLDVSRGIDEHFFHEWLNANPIEAAKYKEQMAQAKGDSRATEHVKRKFRKAAGVERKIIRERQEHDIARPKGGGDERLMTSAGQRETRTIHEASPSTPAAKQWQGWGTALKPALEPICMARKPLSEKTVAANVLRWGTGGINVDGGRVETDNDLNGGAYAKDPTQRNDRWVTQRTGDKNCMKRGSAGNYKQPPGRFPANLIHDGSQGVLELFPESSITGLRKNSNRGQPEMGVTPFSRGKNAPEYTDSGSAARFFYCAKASKKDRGEGNNHPTVKPVSLIAYLIKLVSPPGAIVLDPFCGSGTTVLTADKLGRHGIGLDLKPEYSEMARKRVFDDAPLLSL